MLRLVLGAAAFGSLAASANACRVYQPQDDLSAIWEALPDDLPQGTVVAQVKFENPNAGWDGLFNGTRVGVKRVIQGRYGGKTIIVRDKGRVRVTCYDPIRFGGSGYIIGYPRGYKNGVLVLQPMFAQPAKLGKRPIL